jgi:hypothetical protein|tara:strand:- start:205 stop:435 length:231 start_codon:yes stop_codon:yes gene_type:complete
MLVKDLQQFLGSFTDKLKGNAISHAKIFVEKDGYLEEIRRMEVQEHTLIGQPGLRLVLKTHKDKKLLLNDKLMKNY